MQPRIENCRELLSMGIFETFCADFHKTKSHNIIFNFYPISNVANSFKNSKNMSLEMRKYQKAPTNVSQNFEKYTFFSYHGTVHCETRPNLQVVDGLQHSLDQQNDCCQPEPSQFIYTS